MTALITGSTGFIGSRLMASLAGDGVTVRGLTRRLGPHPQPLSRGERGETLTPGPSPKERGEWPSPPAPFPGGEGGLWVVGDLLDADALVRACEGVETVFHCAGIAQADGGVDEARVWQVNVEGTRNLLMAAGEAGARRFVFLSSVKAMADPGDDCVDEDWPGEPDTPYGRAKRAGEEAVLEAGVKFGMHVVNLRLALVYGQGNRGNLWKLAQAIRRHPWLGLPQTHNRRSLVHVQDVVTAMRLVAERPEANGRTYIIAAPQPYSTVEIEAAMRAALGLRPPLLRIPASPLRLAARLHPRLREVGGRLLGSACYSPARIEQELGWRARVGLAEGMREMLGDEAQIQRGAA